MPALPGCVTEGETLAEVKANAAEAITGWLKAADKRGRKKYANGKRAKDKVRFEAVEV